MNRALATLLVATVLSACSGGPRLNLVHGQYAQVQQGQAGLPLPQGADAAADLRPYRLGPYDKIRIEVYGMEDMNREVQLDANGQFSFPLAGVVEGGGMTPRDVEATVARQLRAAHVRDPRVTVNVTETVSQVVTIDGQVTQPGQYPVVGRMTLVRAIASARGTTEFARSQNVLVFRRVNGQQMVGLYNLSAIRQGIYGDPEIFANDVIVVDEDRARRLFRDLLQLAPTLAAPLVAVLQSNSN